MTNKALLKNKEAADYLGVKPNTLAVWACTKRYDLPYIKIGRKRMYKTEDLDQFININRYSSTSKKEVQND